jgi:hypothetical protein
MNKIYIFDFGYKENLQKLASKYVMFAFSWHGA